MSAPSRENRAVWGDLVPGVVYPIAYPPGYTKEPVETVVRDGNGGLAGANTPASSSTPTPAGRHTATIAQDSDTTTTPASGTPRRVGARMRERLARELSERDMEVLEMIGAHRYLSTIQITALVFTDHASNGAAARTTRRVVTRLQRDGLIRCLERRIGGIRAGSEARIWQLAPAGARIISPERGRQWRTHEPSTRFLAHTLTIADIHVILRHGQSREAIEQVAVEIEPASWRRFAGIGGQTRLIRPDLTAIVHGHDHEGAFTDRWFMEIDMGTESLPTLLTKCHLYMDYYHSGIEQHTHGGFPRVLWIMHGTRATERAHQLQSRILRTPSLDPRLFTICTTTDLPHVLWGDEEANNAPAYGETNSNAVRGNGR